MKRAMRSLALALLGIRAAACASGAFVPMETDVVARSLLPERVVTALRPPSNVHLAQTLSLEPKSSLMSTVALGMGTTGGADAGLSSIHVPPQILPRVIGHRGAKGAAPENTLASIRRAKEEGCTWVEVDVMLTKDKVPVIHHDNTLDRCTQARGNLWEYTLSEIEGLDAGSHFSDDFAGEKIPTLSSLIATCRDLSLGVNLEIKHVTVDADAEPTAEEAAMEAELANRACDVIEQLSVQAHEVVLSSFSRVCIQVLRKRAPHLRCGLLVVAIPNDWIPFIDEHSCVSLNFDHTQSTRTQILACRAARPDIPLYCYTVNNGARAVELLSWGVAGVFTDVPALCEAAIVEAGQQALLGAALQLAAAPAATAAAAASAVTRPHLDDSSPQLPM